MELFLQLFVIAYVIVAVSGITKSIIEALAPLHAEAVAEDASKAKPKAKNKAATSESANHFAGLEDDSTSHASLDADALDAFFEEEGGEINNGQSLKVKQSLKAPKPQSMFNVPSSSSIDDAANAELAYAVEDSSYYPSDYVPAYAEPSHS